MRTQGLEITTCRQSNVHLGFRLLWFVSFDESNNLTQFKEKIPVSIDTIDKWEKTIEAIIQENIQNKPDDMIAANNDQEE